MNISKETTIGDIVAQDYRTASVFKNNGIDFCCNGNRTIAEACSKENMDIDTLVESLNGAMSKKNDTTVDFNSWPLDLLADYIEKKHHRYVETKIKEITPFLEKIIKVHGERHPELSQIGDLFKACGGELAAHMKKEELVLFPYIRKLVKAKAENTIIKAPFGTVQNPIKMMMHDHDIEGERFRKIATLTHNYMPPADACTTYQVTFSMLKEFEDDLHLHIHLENNILFPKSITLEETF